MKMKRLVSAIAALAIAGSAFAGMASAAIVDSYAENFESITTSPFTASGRYTASVADGTGDNATKVFSFVTAGNNNNGDGSYAYKTADYKIVEASFDFNIASNYMSINLGNAEDYVAGMTSYKKSNGMSSHMTGSALSFGTTRQSSANWYGVNNAKANSLTMGSWYHAVVSIDYATSTLDYAVYAYAADADYSAATAVVSGTDVAFVDTNVSSIDSIIVQSSTNSSSAYIDNIDFNTDDAYLAALDYSINYQLDGETVYSETGAESLGTVIPTVDAVFGEDGVKYINDDTTLALTIASEGNVLNVPVRVATNYDVTVDAVGAIEQNLVTGTAVEGEDYSYSYPAYVEADGKFYKAEGTTYGETVTAVGAAIDKDVTYAVAEDVVAFIEGEDVAKTGGSSNYPELVTLSGGKAQSVQRASTEALKFTFNAPVDGKYKLYAALYNADSKNRAYDLYIDDAEYTTVLKNDTIAGKTQGVMEYEVELTAGEHTVYYAINYSLTPAVDYMVVTLLEDLTPKASIDSTIEVVAQYPESDEYEGVATALTATFKITGETSFNYLTFAIGDATAEGAVTVMSGDGAEATYGIVVNALVDADAITATASMTE